MQDDEQSLPIVTAASCVAHGSGHGPHDTGQAPAERDAVSLPIARPDTASIEPSAMTMMMRLM